MPLENTQLTLRRLRDKYGNLLRSAELDIKPTYPHSPIIKEGFGYVYNGIDEIDIHFIYQTIRQLNESINSEESPIYFDINYFITYENAVKKLELLSNWILEDIDKLKKILEKYKDREECDTYPIQVCIDKHEIIYNVLDEIFKSDEYREFKNPGQIESLSSENNELKFKLYWQKRKWRYITHLIAFFPFLFLSGWIFFHRDNHDFAGWSNVVVLVAGGLITIIFTLLFNNHSSFKDSWKLLIKSSRKKLIENEKKIFLKKP